MGQGFGAVRFVQTPMQMLYKKFAWLSNRSATPKLLVTSGAGTDDMPIETPTLVKLAAKTPRSLTALAPGLSLPLGDRGEYVLN